MLNFSRDIREMLKETGWTVTMLSKYAQVSLSGLQKLLAKEESNSIYDKLIPFIYGDKRPPKLPELPPAPLPKNPCKKKPSE